jgi:hypothetical protein
MHIVLYCSGVKAENWPAAFFSNSGTFCVPDMTYRGILDRAFDSGTLPASPGRLANILTLLQQCSNSYIGSWGCLIPRKDATDRRAWTSP